MNSKLALAGAECQLSRFDHQTDHLLGRELVVKTAVIWPASNSAA
jgi:hypothetical protein